MNICPLRSLVLVLFLAVPLSADDTSGEAVYAKKCASCHGAKGEGTKEHPDPLIGSRTIDKLAAYIAKSMPEDKPGTCVGEEAKKVAEYMHQAFYSLAARARAKPPRIDLARLTVKQYKNAVADLFVLPGEIPKWDERRGLRAEYYTGGRRFRNPVLERVTPRLSEDYGAGSPAEKINAEEFSVRWSGGLLAPETGLYEFNLETANGARLWINSMDRPLYDAWVRSGDDKAHRATIFLLGGRVYPLKVEFFKAKKETAASCALKWKAPGRAEELVPERSLNPGKFAESLVLAAAFPPDDRSLGFERGASVSREWDEAATSAALEAAAWAYAKLPTLAGLKMESQDAKARLRDWGRRFAQRAFRRPLSTQDQEFFVDRHVEADLEMGLKRIVLLVLKSPRFLYPELGTSESDAYDVATRISLALWDSLPDAELLEAAKNGQLDGPDGVARQVERMLPDLRTRAKLMDFFHHWLNLDRLHELAKDPKLFPEFNQDVVADLRTSLDLFLDDIAWGETPDFRQFLLSDGVYLNGRLSKLYGGDLPADAPFQKVPLGPDKRAGVLTHPLLMAGFADHANGSPIHRGVFIARGLLGRRLRPPPDAVTPMSPDLHPEMSTRERVALQTKSQACLSCHTMINPLGFALENFDAVGRWRAQEKGRPVDASGAYESPSGDLIKFTGSKALAETLAKSEETHAAFIEHLFHALVKQPVMAYGIQRPERLRQAFVKNEFNVRKLMADIVVTSAMKGKNP